MDPVLARIDAFCDAVPRRHATVVDDGPLRLFVRTGPGFPLYCRPIPGAGPVVAADVERMRQRQQAIGAGEAFEWVHAAAPTMEDAAREAGLTVQRCPLLVLHGRPAEAPLPERAVARLLDPDDRDLAVQLAGVSEVGAAAFGVPAPPPPDLAAVATAVADLESGASIRLLVSGPNGPVAAGQVQRVPEIAARPSSSSGVREPGSRGDLADGVAELVGIGTLAAYRGVGIGAAVTAQLAAVARARGDDLVFLAAADDTATRVYERVGFRVVGTCGLASPPG